MKTLLSLLATLAFVAPAFADTIVEIKSVELLETKANGKPWDLKIPLKKGSQFPDIVIEVMVDSKSVFKTTVQKDSLSANYTSNKFQVPDNSSMIIKVLDKDLGPKKDVAAEIPFSLKGASGDVKLSSGQVKSLILHVPEAAKPAVEAAPAAKPAADSAPAAKPAAEAAPAAKPATEAAPAAE